MKTGMLLLAGLISVMSVSPLAMAAEASLPGFTAGAKVMHVEERRAQVDTLSGVVYAQIIKTRAVRPLKMTLLVPRTSDLKPAIVYFPGGGFTSADYEKFIEMRLALAQAGFVVAAAEYRTVPDMFPALLEDGKAAVRYLRAHAADYGIDPDRIGVLGDSAGGYLAEMLGVTNGEKKFDRGDFLSTSSDVQAAVTLYGISNLLNISEGFPDDLKKVHESPAVTEALLVNGPAFAQSMGAAITSDPAKALAASPMGHVEGRKPPFLIMHGSADTLVSPVQSRQFYKALVSRENKADYVLVDGAGHGDLNWFQPKIINMVVDWFKGTLGEPIKKAH